MLAQHHGFLPPCLPQWEGWGKAKYYKETHLGQLIPTDQRDIPYPMSLCPEIKTGRRRRKGKLWHLSCQVTTVCAGPLLPRKRLDICKPKGSNEFITYFVFLAHATFVFSVKLLSTQSVSLLTFLLLSQRWGGRGVDWVDGSLGASQGQPTILAN